MVTRHQAARNRGDGRKRRMYAAAPEQPVGDLIRQVGTDGLALVRNEVALAKLEFRDIARDVALDAARIFGALALALAGLLALLAGAIIALGNALGGRYALAAVIVGAIMFVGGALLGGSGVAALKRATKPEQTVATVRSASRWVWDEISDFSQEIRS
jgi:hypothetical protein